MNNTTIHIPVQIIPIEDDGYHLTVKAVINQVQALLLIDTGASRTVFDLNRIRNFIGEQIPEPHDKLSTGLGTNSMVTHTAFLSDFRIGAMVIPDFQAVLLDLNHVNESYTKLGIPVIDGVLGSDLLKKYKAVIDYGASEIILST